MVVPIPIFPAEVILKILVVVATLNKVAGVVVPMPTFQLVEEAKRLEPDNPQSWACLLLKVAQSVEVKSPLLAAEAEGS